MADDSLADFIDEASSESRLRVDEDLGGGFVRLRLTEAERRQAAQDVRSSEDILIELLRNARDAHARHIYVALARDGARRLITVIDDGDGIPEAMQQRVFEPRVTSKLDTAHMDKWGMHGRGMALFSIDLRAESARVACSEPGCGCAIAVATDTARLGERADQSTMPTFELKEGGVAAMRGPRNLLRVCAEFALETRGECAVFCGSPVEVAATLYAFGMATTTPSLRAFNRTTQGLPLVKRLALAADGEGLAQACEEMGLSLSARTARRIMDGQVSPLVPMDEALKARFDQQQGAASKKGRPRDAKASSQGGSRSRGGRRLKLAPEDERELLACVEAAYAGLAERYYLDPAVRPALSVADGALRLTIPIQPLD